MAKSSFQPEMINGPSYPEVSTIADTSYTLASSDAGNLLKFTSDSDITISVPLNATALIPIGSTVTIMQLGNGVITVQGVPGVQILGESSLVSRGTYYTITIAKTDTDQWVTPTNNGKLNISVQETEPNNPQVGDLWFW